MLLTIQCSVVQYSGTTTFPDHGVVYRVLYARYGDGDGDWDDSSSPTSCSLSVEKAGVCALYYDCSVTPYAGGPVLCKLPSVCVRDYSYCLLIFSSSLTIVLVLYSYSTRTLYSTRMSCNRDIPPPHFSLTHHYSNPNTPTIPYGALSTR